MSCTSPGGVISTSKGGVGGGVLEVDALKTSSTRLFLLKNTIYLISSGAHFSV